MLACLKALDHPRLPVASLQLIHVLCHPHAVASAPLLAAAQATWQGSMASLLLPSDSHVAMGRVLTCAPTPGAAMRFGGQIDVTGRPVLRLLGPKTSAKVKAMRGRRGSKDEQNSEDQYYDEEPLCDFVSRQQPALPPSDVDLASLQVGDVA